MVEGMCVDPLGTCRKGRMARRPMSDSREAMGMAWGVDVLKGKETDPWPSSFICVRGEGESEMLRLLWPLSACAKARAWDAVYSVGCETPRVCAFSAGILPLKSRAGLSRMVRVEGKVQNLRESHGNRGGKWAGASRTGALKREAGGLGGA